MNQHCPKCQATLPENARFCHSCGRALDKSSIALKPKHLAIILGTALLICGGVWAIATSMLGTAPTSHFADQSEEAAAPELNPLREQAENSPEDKTKWNALGKALAQRMNESQDVPIALVFELIDVLGQVLKIDPRDSEALLGMAEISFSRQAFDKAAQYYKRYLEVNDKDAMSRARYASALTFLGSYEEAISELTTILKDKPEDFHALAYLSIAYAQSGDRTNARKTGEQALAKAPNEEAKARFTKYLEDIEQSETQPKTAAIAPSPEQNSPEVKTFLTSIRESPLTGSKFKRHERKGDALWLYLADFPMDKMPDFAREKFLGRLKENVRMLIPIGVKTVILADDKSGREMARVEP